VQRGVLRVCRTLSNGPAWIRTKDQRKLFARIDHAAGARKADVELEANVLRIFGNTRVGTPLMQADPHVGIELPLRMLIWQDPEGTHVGYLDPRELAERHALDGQQQTLERQSAVLAKLAAAAAG
jgi:uncharacterized protein (DUF302 family)